MERGRWMLEAAAWRFAVVREVVVSMEEKRSTG